MLLKGPEAVEKLGAIAKEKVFPAVNIIYALLFWSRATKFKNQLYVVF